MQILIDVDELRTISTLSAESAQKMEEAGMVITTVVSRHDWKCPERVSIDDSLETIKNNVVELTDLFRDFSSQIIEIANAYTDFINNQIRMNATYMEDVASLMTELNSEGAIVGSSYGGQLSNVVSSLEDSSLDSSNIASLHSANEPINMLDFSLFTE